MMQIIYICGICLTREVTHCDVKSVRHAHAGQDIFQVIRLLHLESRQLHFNLSSTHHVRTSPLSEFLVGQLLLQLMWTQYRLLVCLFQTVHLFTVSFNVPHLLQACGVVLYLVGQEDEHAELLPFIGHL